VELRENWQATDDDAAKAALAHSLRVTINPQSKWKSSSYQGTKNPHSQTGGNCNNTTRFLEQRDTVPNIYMTTKMMGTEINLKQKWWLCGESPLTWQATLFFRKKPFWDKRKRHCAIVSSCWLC